MGTDHSRHTHPIPIPIPMGIPMEIPIPTARPCKFLTCQLLSSLQYMAGRDSSDAKSAESIALLALAAFSTSYNLPVYLHYNITCITSTSTTRLLSGAPTSVCCDVSRNREATVSR